MAEEPITDEGMAAEEESIATIFSESRADLATASSQQREVTIQKARHGAGIADFIILLLRTGKTALGMLGLLFSAGEKPDSGEEK